jgi:hypothetical protein
MVEHLREFHGVGRVAIVDTDCHHGDGTQDIYWHDPETLYISLHQDGRTLFPGSGFPGEIGGPKARGRTLNIPLPPNTSDEGFLAVMDNVVVPVLEHFKPDVIVNSAGQDNHFTDPITNMRFSAQGYAALNTKLNPDIAVLEGGYSIQGALPYVNLGIVLAMAGLDYSFVREPDYDPESLRQEQRINDYVKRVSEVVLKNYFNPPSSEVSQDKQDGYYVRSKEVFYDTSFITERQREFVLDCTNCRGLLVIETSSSKIRNCLAIEVPRGACQSCAREGERKFAEAKDSDRYSNVQYINRLEGTTQRHRT